VLRESLLCLRREETVYKPKIPRGSENGKRTIPDAAVQAERLTAAGVTGAERPDQPGDGLAIMNSSASPARLRLDRRRGTACTRLGVGFGGDELAQRLYRTVDQGFHPVLPCIVPSCGEVREGKTLPEAGRTSGRKIQRLELEYLG
jgi:hypothetical protein